MFASMLVWVARTGGTLPALPAAGPLTPRPPSFPRKPVVSPTGAALRTTAPTLVGPPPTQHWQWFSEPIGRFT